LHVLPGSHIRGRARTRTDKDAFGNLELDPTEAEGKRAMPLEVPAGTVVWFGPFLIHKSEPNTSHSERRSLLYTYQPARCRTGYEYEQQRAEERRAQKKAAR
jgi:ectoine hydroxylase